MATVKPVYVLGDYPFVIRSRWSKEVRDELLMTYFPDGKPPCSLDEAVSRCRRFADRYRHLPEMAEVVRVMDDLPAALEASKAP